MSLDVRQATVEDLEQLVPLFDRFRQFCQQPADADLARRFLAERLQRGESVILVAGGADRLLGFAQLYPGFSSVDAGPTLVLSDLFVVADARRKGVAQALLAAAARVGRARGVGSLSLATARANVQARTLYESRGWKQDEFFVHYRLLL